MHRADRLAVAQSPAADGIRRAALAAFNLVGVSIFYSCEKFETGLCEVKAHDPCLWIVTFEPILHGHSHDLRPVQRAQFLNLPRDGLADYDRQFKSLRQCQDGIFSGQISQGRDARRVQRSGVAQRIGVRIVKAHWFILQAPGR